MPRKPQRCKENGLTSPSAERAATAPELDILIPVYNEGENIVPVLDTLAASVRTPFRILICYDFEEDDTLPALKSNAYPFEITCVKNAGKGVHAAIMTGFGASRAPAVLVFPADDTLNAVMLDGLYQKIKEGCDVAAASRFIPGGEMVNCPWLKDFLVRASSFTMNALARLPIHDASNGFRMFSRRVIDEIPIESTLGFTYSIEMTVKAHRLGWKMGEVPARWRERTKGKSRFKVMKWLFPYLRWYLYAFATTWLFRRHVKGYTGKDIRPALPQAKAHSA